MYIARRVWLFNSGGSKEIFEFKTEKAELEKKEQGWFESLAEAKKSISPEVKTITKAVETEPPVVEPITTESHDIGDPKEPEKNEDNSFDHEKYPIKFSDDKE